MGPHEQPHDMPQETHFEPTAGQSVIGQFQYTMAQWLELQKEMVQSGQKFLETQQAVMMAALQGTNGHVGAKIIAGAMMPAPSPRPAAPVAPVVPPVAAVAAPPMPAPVAVAAAAPAVPKVHTATAPVLPTLKPAASARVAIPAAPAPAQRSVAAAPPAPAPARAATAAAAPATPVAAPAAKPTAKPHESNGSDGAPPVEVFRKDLLDVISDRTGYPIEMLDEKLDLETGLGIDSIKTLEILSMLGKYNAYLPGADEDQEATMATFASLRTIGDIVRAYQGNVERVRQASPVRAAAQPSANGSNGTVVQRAGLRAVEAPRDGALKKKPSLEATSS